MPRRQKFTKFFLPLLAIIIFGLGIGAFFAYFTHTRRLINTFTVGENVVSITEDFEPPKEMAKGLNTYTKKVTITNTGNTDAFVRVYAAFSDSDIADNSFIASSKPKNVSITSDAAFDLVTSSMESAGYKTSTNFWAEGGPSNDWVYVPDSDSILGGYFYYTKSIIPGESTKALMDTITTWFADENDVRDYELIVYAESVQTADKDGVSFSDVDYQKAWIEYLTRK